MKRLCIITFGSLFALYGTPVLAEDPEDDDWGEEEEEEEDNDDGDDWGEEEEEEDDDGGDDWGEEEEEEEDDDGGDDWGEEEEEEEEEEEGGLIAEICNKTKADIYAAYASEQGDGDYASEGWYRIRRGKCKELGTDLSGDIFMVAMTTKTVGKGKRYLPKEGGDTRSFCVDRNVKNDEFWYPEGNCKKQGKGVVSTTFGRVFDKDDDGIARFNVK